MKILLVALSAVAMLVNACSDTPVAPANPDKYVVTSSSSYYVSDVEVITHNASDTNNPTVTPMGTDSAYVVKTVLIGNPSRTGALLRGTLKVNDVAVSNDTTYLSQDGHFTYQYYTLGVSDIPSVGSIFIGHAWVRIADNSSATWTALDTIVPDVEFELNSTKLKADVDINMQGSTVGTETITIAGTTHSAKHFRVTGVVSIDHPFATATAYTTEDFWFVKDVGMVKYERAVSTVDFSLAPETIRLPGKRKTVTSFKVF